MSKREDKKNRKQNLEIIQQDLSKDLKRIFFGVMAPKFMMNQGWMMTLSSHKESFLLSNNSLIFLKFIK
jgi:hypothetical protein